jgi:hypothetical protein
MSAIPKEPAAIEGQQKYSHISADNNILWKQSGTSATPKATPNELEGSNSEESYSTSIFEKASPVAKDIYRDGL